MGQLRIAFQPLKKGHLIKRTLTSIPMVSVDSNVESVLSVVGYPNSVVLTGIQEYNVILQQGVERPLILAAYVGNGHIVQFLLKHGADIYKRDEVSRYILLFRHLNYPLTTEWCSCF